MDCGDDYIVGDKKVNDLNVEFSFWVGMYIKFFNMIGDYFDGVINGVWLMEYENFRGCVVYIVMVFYRVWRMLEEEDKVGGIIIENLIVMV